MKSRFLPLPFLFTVLLISVGAAVSGMLGERPAPQLHRSKLINFPLQIDQWRGRQESLEDRVLNALKLTDHIIANYYRGRSREPVNLYVAYYKSQSAGQSAHSPSSCIPGGGWEIEDIREYTISEVVNGVQPLVVNRALIAKGNLKQLVFYWFAQRGRHLTSEYLVKWYLFWDGLMRGRTDGALVRLVTPISPNESVWTADNRLSEFLRAVYPNFASHVPN